VSYVASRPSQRLFVDCTDFHGGYYLTAVDAFSKFIWVVWCKYGENKSGKTAAKIANLFETQFIPKFSGQIATLKADQGPEFGAEFDAMLTHNNIKRIRGHVHTPQGNGMVERANATIKNMVTSAIGQRGVDGVNASFKMATTKALKLYNSSVNPMTGWAPDILNGPDIPDRILADIKLKLRQNAEPNEHNVKMLPRLAPGQAVRLDVLETDNEKLAAYKDGQHKATHEANWTKEIYHVRTFFPSSNSVSLVEDVDVLHTRPGDEVKKSGYRFNRGRVLPINTPVAPPPPPNPPLLLRIPPNPPLLLRLPPPPQVLV
jgi:transposase InsO family protein